MTRRIVINDDRVGRYVAERAKCEYVPGVTPVIGVVRPYEDCQSVLWGDSEVLGGAIFSGYTQVACFIHAAGKDEYWATRDFLWAIFDYPFGFLGCSRLFAVVDENNLPMRKIVHKLNFEEVARLPGLFPSSDGLVFCLLRDRCKWLSVTPRTIRRNTA